jgi:hypothetical protein
MRKQHSPLAEGQSAHNRHGGCVSARTQSRAAQAPLSRNGRVSSKIRGRKQPRVADGMRRVLTFAINAPASSVTLTLWSANYRSSSASSRTITYFYSWTSARKCRPSHHLKLLPAAVTRLRWFPHRTSTGDATVLSPVVPALKSLTRGSNSYHCG